MKRFFLLALILLLLGAGLGVWLLNDPGYILFSHGNLSIEMSLWLAVVGWFISLLLALFAISILLQILGLANWWARWQSQRRQSSSVRAFQEGCIALELGDWKKAERLLFDAARRSSHPLPAYLAAARAAARGQAFDRAEQYLVLAEEKGNKLAISLARARLLLDNERWEQASILLGRLHDQHRRDDHILLLHLEALIRLKKWGELAEILPRLNKLPEGEHSPFEAMERHAHREVMAWLATSSGKQDRLFVQKKLNRYWENLPKRLRHNSEIAAIYANELIQAGGDDEAEALLAEHIGRQWHNRAIEVYGRTRSTRPDQALARALLWKEAHPHNPTLLLALGRLCLQNRRWDEARDYFEASLSLRQSVDAQAELLRLQARQGGKNDAQIQEMLLLQHTQLPDLPLP